MRLTARHRTPPGDRAPARISRAQLKAAKGQAKTVRVTGIAITNEIPEIGVDAIKEDMLARLDEDVLAR